MPRPTREDFSTCETCDEDVVWSWAADAWVHPGVPGDGACIHELTTAQCKRRAEEERQAVMEFED